MWDTVVDSRVPSEMKLYLGSVNFLGVSNMPYYFQWLNSTKVVV